MRNLLVSTAASLALLGSREADAGTAVWSTVASDCAIDSAYASNALVNSNDGSVSFASGTTGYVAMSCRVPPMSFGCSYPRVYMTSSGDANNTGADSHYVTAWFNGIPKGSSSTVSNHAWVWSGATYVSKADETGDGDADSGSEGYFTASSINFNSNYYWISVVIHRDSTSQSIKFWGTSIVCL